MNRLILVSYGVLFWYLGDLILVACDDQPMAGYTSAFLLQALEASFRDGWFSGSIAVRCMVWQQELDDANSFVLLRPLYFSSPKLMDLDVTFCDWI